MDVSTSKQAWWDSNLPEEQGFGHLRPRGTQALTLSYCRSGASCVCDCPERLDLVILTLWPPGTE